MKNANPAPDGLEADDRPLFEAVGELYRKRTRFGRQVEDKPDGAFHQWAYFQFGVPAFAAKVFEGAPPKPSSQPRRRSPRRSRPARRPRATTPSASSTPTRASAARASSTWKPFKHPTLGDVEIGGFVPLADVNPTADRIPDLARAHAQFVFDLLELLPRVEPARRRREAARRRAPRGDRGRPERRPLPDGAADRHAQPRRLPSRVVVDLPRESFELGERRTMLEPLGSVRPGPEAPVDRARAGGQDRDGHRCGPRRRARPRRP